MQVVSFLQANQQIEMYCRQQKKILAENSRLALIETSGRLDIWLLPLTDYLVANPWVDVEGIYGFLDDNGYFSALLKQIPQEEHIYLLAPSLAPASSRVRSAGLISGNRLFSPLFARWLCGQPLIDQLVKIDAQLTKAEAGALRVLWQKFGRLCTRDEIASGIWGSTKWYEKYSDWMIDTIISRIRKKLMVKWRLKTLRGRGYLLISRETLNNSAPECPKSVRVVSSIVPPASYIRYMNNPSSMRKTLTDLFAATHRCKLDQVIFKRLNSFREIKIAIINSYSVDNVDAVFNWAHKLFPKQAAEIYFTHFDERALIMHHERIESLGKEAKRVYTLYDDLRARRLEISSFDLVINDFRFNFNATHEENLSMAGYTHEVLVSTGMVLVSVVVDVRYDVSRYGRDQERAPINMSAPWLFEADEGLQRYCFTVPYYKKLFSRANFRIIREFDQREGKIWMRKLHGDPRKAPSYRRFLLAKA